MPGISGYLRDLARLEPSANDHLPALRVGLGVTVPVLLLLLAGHSELSIYAVFGAFTGMYGRGEAHQFRLVHQLQAAAMLLTGVTVGALLSAAHVQSWGLVATEAVLAAIGSLFADKVRLKPTGPFFGIFALGACASVPPIVPVWVAALICAGSAGFSVLVGFAGWFRGRVWDPAAKRRTATLTGRRRASAQLHALRYLVAVGAAGAIGILSGTGHAYWAMAAAAVPLAAADTSSRVRRGVHRILGTFAGVGLTALVLWPQPPAIVLAVVVMLFQFPTELFMARHYALAMLFFTPVILLMTQLANPIDPRFLIADRAAQTVVGAVVGILVVIAFRRFPRLRPLAK